MKFLFICSSFRSMLSQKYVESYQHLKYIQLKIGWIKSWKKQFRGKSSFHKPEHYAMMSYRTNCPHTRNLNLCGWEWSCSPSDRYIWGRPTHWRGDVGFKANLDKVVARIKIPEQDGNRFPVVQFVGNHFSDLSQLTYLHGISAEANIRMASFWKKGSIGTLGQPDPLDGGKSFSSRWQIEYVSSFKDIFSVYLQMIDCIRQNGYMTAPCSRVSCEKLKVARIFKIFPVFYEIWMYITLFTGSTSEPCPQPSEFIDTFTDYLLRL
jgi:hypothetical protein